MGALSDGEIKERIAAGGLVIGGDPNSADASSYEFRAGAIIRTGDDPSSSLVDWAGDDTGTAVYSVAPGELVWVRTSETVDMPDDLCAFWWQTNRLSRLGLMLINMTMVEPGYKGPLACLFANFGQRHVEITRDTVVARLVFFDLNRSAERPFSRRMTPSEYDRALVTSATSAPRKFLDLESLSGDVKRQLDEAVALLDRRKEHLTQDLERAAAKAGEDATKTFTDDTKGTMLRATGWGLAAVALLTVASLAAGWIKNQVTPTPDDVRTQVEDTLDRLADNAQVTEDVARLRAEVAELRRQLATSTPSPSPRP